jgi:hypothetical protein
MLEINKTQKQHIHMIGSHNKKCILSRSTQQKVSKDSTCQKIFIETMTVGATNQEPLRHTLRRRRINELWQRMQETTAVSENQLVSAACTNTDLPPVTIIVMERFCFKSSKGCRLRKMLFTNTFTSHKIWKKKGKEKSRCLQIFLPLFKNHIFHYDQMLHYCVFVTDCLTYYCSLHHSDVKYL